MRASSMAVTQTLKKKIDSREEVKREKEEQRSKKRSKREKCRACWCRHAIWCVRDIEQADPVACRCVFYLCARRLPTAYGRGQREPRMQVQAENEVRGVEVSMSFLLSSERKREEARERRREGVIVHAEYIE